MTTGKKLWLGFGILTALLILFGVGVASWLRAIDSGFQGIASGAAPLRQAVYEMEVNVNGTGLAVFNYLATNDPEQGKRVADDALDFAQFKAQFDRHAPTSQEYLIERTAVLYREFKALGDVLMEQRDQGRVRREDLRKFSDLRDRLDRLLDHEIQPLILRQFQAAEDAVARSILTIQWAVPILLVIGSLIAVTTSVAVGRGVTEAERALLRAHDELEDRVQQRTAELATANLALSRSNRELEQFASVASHDLQEPLRKIQAFGDRLASKYAAGLGDQGREYVERIMNSAARMRTLIADLLTFSRVATKAQPFQPVNLTAIANEVVSDLEGQIQQTNGRVDIEGLPEIEADPLQMRQLLQNLIGNGLKFHRSGIPPNVAVRARIVEADAACELTVQDNGIGFEEIYLDRIFEVFQRLHGRGEYEGTGMGLAICRKIVERHGGQIAAKATPGQGATFVITLPVHQPGDDHG